MKVYSPSEIAFMLQIKTATLRKYSLLLERYGYEIERNSKGHRYYRDEDVMTLRNVIAGMKSGVTLKQSVQNVVTNSANNSYRNDTNNDMIANNTDISELKETVHKQNELIKGLADRLDKQEDRANERDQALMQAINESFKTQKQIATSKEKQGFFARLFNRNR